VKGSIESRNLWDGREAGARSIDAGHRRRVVQWRKLGQLEDLIAHAFVDDHRLPKPQPAVHDAVPDCLDWGHAGKCRLELNLVATDVATFPAGLPLILNCFTLSVQNHPF
jgi:hypothetical protein